MFRILQMFKNVRGPITVNVLTYARGKMSGSFADIAGTTARTQKLVNHTRTEPTRDRILLTEHAAHLSTSASLFTFSSFVYLPSSFSLLRLSRILQLFLV